MNSQLIIRDGDVDHAYNCANGFISRCVAAVHVENHSDARKLARILNDHFQSALSKPAPVAANASAEAEEEEEFYEIGLRDGYEDAIQDLDIATGGDGEFKGSSTPGETVDVPAMRARIISRFVNASAEARLREALTSRHALILSNAAKYKWKNGEGAWDRAFGEISGLNFALEALSTHPHASDCDKKGEEPDADHTPHNFSDAGGDTCRYCGNVEDSPVHKRPSDRTADDLPAIRSANDWDK